MKMFNKLFFHFFFQKNIKDFSKFAKIEVFFCHFEPFLNVQRNWITQLFHNFFIRHGFTIFFLF